MHSAPNASAFFTPFHAGGGCGAFQRSSPTGGAANGMPLKTRTPSTAVPAISPPSTLTVSEAAANRQAHPTTVASKTIRPFDFIMLLRSRVKVRERLVQNAFRVFVVSWLPLNDASRSVAGRQRSHRV